MKKVILISTFFLFAGMNLLLAQNNTSKYSPLPIPSFNVLVTGETAFSEATGSGMGGNTKEKRDVIVRVSSTSHGMMKGDATVWVVKDMGAFVLGPYTVQYDETLTVPVDFGNWGVVIKAQTAVLADVWFSDQQ